MENSHLVISYSEQFPPLIISKVNNSHPDIFPFKFSMSCKPGYFPGLEFSRMDSVYVGDYERWEFTGWAMSGLWISRLVYVRGYSYLLVTTKSCSTGTCYQKDVETRAFGPVTTDTWLMRTINHRDPNYVNLKYKEATDTKTRPIWICYQWDLIYLEY